MATNAKTGIGAYLNRWVTENTAGVWAEIVEVTALGWAGPSRNVITTFKLNNADDYVNKLQGVLNAQTVTASINYTFAEWVNLKDMLETRGNDDFQLVLPDGEAIEFEGFITELPLEPIGSDAVMAGDLVIEIDGQASLVSSSSLTADPTV